MKRRKEKHVINQQSKPLQRPGLNAQDTIFLLHYARSCCSCVEPVLGRVLHADEGRRRASGRGATTGSLNTVHLTQADTGTVVGLRNEGEPVDGTGIGGPPGGVGRGDDVTVLGAVEHLADGSQVEGWRAVGGEEVVAQQRQVVCWRRKRVRASCGRRGVVDSGAWDGVQHGHAVLGDRGGIVERGYGSDQQGRGADAGAGVVLNSAAQSDILKSESG